MHRVAGLQHAGPPCRLRPRRRFLAVSTALTIWKDGVESRFFRRDGKFFVATNGPDGKARRLRDQLYVRCRSPAAVSHRSYRGTPFKRSALRGTRGPKVRAGQRWFDLYPDQDVARWGSSQLERHRPELEPPMRGLPLHRSQEKLRSRDQELCHDVVGDQCRLRGCHGAGRTTCRVGPEERRQ